MVASPPVSRGVALVAEFYGRRVTRALRHPGQHWGNSLRAGARFAAVAGAGIIIPLAGGGDQPQGAPVAVCERVTAGRGDEGN